MKTIKKEITVTKVSFVVVENGKVDELECTLSRSFTSEKALKKALIEKTGYSDMLVTNTEVTRKVYEMPLDDFISIIEGVSGSGEVEANGNGQ